MPVGGADGMGGGGGDIQLRKAEALRRDMQALKGGDYSNEDLLYKWLSGTPGTSYREEAFRDPQWVSWQKERPDQAMADAEDYKRMIMEAGDPRGLFSGNITNTRYQSPGEIDQTYKYLDHFNRMTSVLGMDPSKMSANVQSNLSGNIAPWATTAQHTALTNANNANTTPVNTGGGAPGTYNAATNSYSPAPSNAGWQPFMNLDEAESYYGQYANGGPVALRRKMFSMGGGVDKSHGVGLTSGLTKTVPPQRGPMAQGYKTGGQVVPQRVGYQPANHPHRQGNREGHSGVRGLAWLGQKLLPWVLPGAKTVAQGSKALSKGKFKDWMKYGTEGTETIAKRKEALIAARKAAEEARKAAEKALKVSKTGTATGPKSASAVSKLKEFKRLKREAEKLAGGARGPGAGGAGALTGGLGGLGGQIGRGLRGAGALGFYGSGALPSSVIPTYELDEDSSMLDYLGAGAQQLSRLPMQAGLSLYDTLTGKPEDIVDNLIGYGPASHNWFGYTKGDPEAAAIDTTDLKPVEFATAAEQQEKMKQEYLQKIELYKELLGAETQDDNLGTFADTMFAMSGALEEGKGWSGALREGNRALGDEVKSRRTAKQDINTAAVNQAFADITGSDQMLQQANLQAVASGDTDFLQTVQIQQEANAAGVPSIGPYIDDGDEIDTDELSKKLGQVFVDYDQKSGGYYVAVNMDGVVRAFNSLERAKAFINGTLT
tara:strand:- start:2418 stop:4568 length:2151 start_codon:yes stop_codon:yes gene_type:complete